MIPHSIKWRLQLWHTFLLAAVVCGLMIGFYAYQRQSEIRAVDDQLFEAASSLFPKLLPPGFNRDRDHGPGPNRGRGFPHLEADRQPEPGPDALPPPEDFRRPPEPPFSGLPNFTPEFDSTRFYYLVWSDFGRTKQGSTNAPVNAASPRLEELSSMRIFRTEGENREFIQFMPNARCLVVGTSLAPTYAHLRNLALTFALTGLGIILSGFGIGYWIANRALKPVAEISAAAREIAAGDLSRRIDASETLSELGQLAGTLNSTFARLEAAFTQQQQFTSDAAHELRTPLSILLTQIQSTLARDRAPAEYRETLEACGRAAQRMRGLVESLLQLARLDAGQEPMQRSACDLARVAQHVIDLLRPLGDEQAISLQQDLQPAPVTGDPDRLAQVVTNLITNAILHNRPNGHALISTRVENGQACLAVSDDGAGIAEEHLPHIFKRFYRADASRSNRTGGSGLGLAISQAIASAHGGTLNVTSTPGEQTSFTLRLPANN